MILENINSYDEKKFKQKFESSSLYEKVYQDHDLILYQDNLDIFEYKNILKPIPDSNLFVKKDFCITPRRWLSLSLFDAVAFYYLKYLTDLNPSKIYDIGCGSNVFKKYIPNIIGVDISDAKNTWIKNTIDVYDDSLLDNSFYQKNFEKFESAFSICSMHFYSLLDIRKRVLQFSSLISKGGRGYLSLNAARMLENSMNVEEITNISESSINKVDLFIRKQLYNLPFKIEVFDCVVKKQFDNYLNGNIRIVFTKL
jgi:hypothetical protein